VLPLRDFPHRRPGPGGANLDTVHRVGRSLVRLAGVALLAGLLGGCAPAITPLVADGWEIGDPVDCTSNPECDAFVSAATIGLDRRDPQHARIASVHLHLQGKPGSPVLQVCSGGCSVVAVLRLADGSIRAIGVGTPGIMTEPIVFDYGPAWPRN
jgi:hypothetical protein